MSYLYAELKGQSKLMRQALKLFYDTYGFPDKQVFLK